jgi:hypothetical protein
MRNHSEWIGSPVGPVRGRVGVVFAFRRGPSLPLTLGGAGRIVYLDLGRDVAAGLALALDVLHAWGLTGGLWSVLRRFARSESRYRALLEAADEHRRGDLDGRGNLTQTGLVQWIEYTLDICIDRVDFMTQQLDVQDMQHRIRAALAYKTAAVKSGVREEALIALHYLFATQGERGRSQFKVLAPVSVTSDAAFG